jgi:hypothetical protein
MTDTASSTNAQADPNAILIAEFNYISQTAFQANEDRARVSNYYLVTVVASIGAILSSNLTVQEPVAIDVAFAGLFAILTLVGYLTIKQLARLRVAWEDSVRAMDFVKEFYNRNTQGPAVARGLFWTKDTIPPAQNQDSIAFLLVRSVVYVTVGTTVASIAYAGYTIDLLGNFQWPTEKIVVFGVVGLIAGWYVARREYAAYRDMTNRGMDNLQQRIGAHLARFAQSSNQPSSQ